jgi:DNA-binding CsgD family transcriptional regulator
MSVPTKETQTENTTNDAARRLLANDRFLKPFLASPAVGVALFDERWRFRAINSALAAINELPAAAHLGKSTREVLGAFASQVEPYFQQALADRKPVFFEARGSLRTRAKPGHWIETYIPLENRHNGAASVLALVVEVTEKKQIEDALFALNGKVLYVKENLRKDLRELATSGLYKTALPASITRSLELLEQCAQDVAQLIKAIDPTYVPRFAGHRPTALRTTSPPRTLPPAALVDSSASNPLTPREQEVLRLLASSHVNKQIAAILSISVRTVESHRRRIMEKLQIHSLSGLIHYAIRRNLVEA